MIATCSRHEGEAGTRESKPRVEGVGKRLDLAREWRKV